MPTRTFEAIRKFLDRNQIDYRPIHHDPTPTSLDSARARGEELVIGGKAIVLKVDDTFRLVVLSAARRLHSKAIKTYFGAKKTRFATVEELEELTGLVPGAVPPFGRPILDLSLYLDQDITSNDRIAFNAGSLTDSIIMKMEDYLRVAQPTIFSFSETR